MSGNKAVWLSKLQEKKIEQLKFNLERIYGDMKVNEIANFLLDKAIFEELNRSLMKEEQKNYKQKPNPYAENPAFLHSTEFSANRDFLYPLIFDDFEGLSYL